MITKQGDVGSEFLRQLAKSGDGEPALGCMQCGLCAASCPLGECDRMFGEEGLFETLVEYNQRQLDAQDYNTIVMLDPHGFRALQNFYPRYGRTYPAEHYITFLADRLEKLKPLLTRPVEAAITYHDNCCVGRRCECFEPPRQLLEAIPGVKLLEMVRNRDNALCCGGGTVSAVAIDFGEVEGTLYTASAKGADRVVKISWEEETVAPRPHVAAGMLAEAIKPLGADLVLVGVSGAPEHQEGMAGSDLVIAVNTDPKAPIFDVARYGVEMDLMDLVEPLIEAIQAKKGGG